ncbi:hypothetical protein QYF36_011717 [Acer negundo]|nr:hypothetical protein QYF36_011717 [Acer negundo]
MPDRPRDMPEHVTQDPHGNLKSFGSMARFFTRPSNNVSPNKNQISDRSRDVSKHVTQDPCGILKSFKPMARFLLGPGTLARPASVYPLLDRSSRIHSLSLSPPLRASNLLKILSLQFRASQNAAFDAANVQIRIKECFLIRQRLDDSGTFEEFDAVVNEKVLGFWHWNTMAKLLERVPQNLNYGAYGHLIQYFGDHRLPRQAKQLHARLVLHSVTPDNFLASKLVTFYSKSNNLLQARHLFDKISQKSIFSCNAMLIAYSSHDMYADTLKLFSSMLSSYSTDLKPDNFTITCVLKALSGLFCESRLAKEVHCYALRCGFDSNVFIVNGLITFYSRCNEFASSRVLFDRMPHRDIVSWNSMIAGYSQGGFYAESKGLYKEMLNSSVRPDGVTVISVLQACGQSNDLVFGMEVHDFIIENKIQMDLWICNALIGLYAKCRSLDYARSLFEEMSEKDEVSYCSIISGHMVHGLVDRAMDLFREMKQPALSTWNAVISGLVQNNRHEGILDLVRDMVTSGLRPNAVTLSTILSMFSYFSNLKGGKEMHGYAIKNGYDRNIYVATAIIDNYAKAGFLTGAQQVFDQSKSRSLVIWTAIISAYAGHGDADMAFFLFNEMLNNGIQPDPVTFTAVLAACAHSGLVDKAREIFDSMSAEYGIQPSVEHYACMEDPAKREFAEDLYTYIDTYVHFIQRISDKRSWSILPTFHLLKDSRFSYHRCGILTSQFTTGKPKLAAWIEELNKIDAYKLTKTDPKRLVESYKNRFLQRVGWGGAICSKSSLQMQVQPADTGVLL